MEPGNYNVAVDAGTGILDKVTKVLAFKLGGDALMMIITTIAVAALTIGILDIFMSDKLLMFKRNKMENKEKGIFTWSVFTVLAIAIPIFIVVMQIMNTQRFTNSLYDMFIALSVGIGLAWLFSRVLAHKMGIKGYSILLGEAMSNIVGIGHRYIAGWIATVIVSIVNTLVKAFHVPYILNYYIFAIIINLILSMVLISIMGASKEMGAANMAGSLIGGLLHPLIRKAKLKELQTKYKKEHNSSEGGE